MTGMLNSRVLRAAAAIFALVGLSFLFVPASFSRVFSDQEFLPHATCYLRNSQLIRLHVTADLVIGLSYVAISGTLAYLVYRARSDIPFHWMFLAFGLFIVTCGFTHFMEVWTVWQPVYWLSGYVKVVTAVASLSTAVLLPPLVPKVRSLIQAARLSERRRILLEEANRELAAANEELKAFTYSASHDLRAPLRTMSSMSALLSEAMPQDASSDARHLAGRIRRGAERMNRLLDDLLAYSGLNKIDAPSTLLQTGDLTRDVLHDMEADVQSRGARIHVASEFPPVFANASLLKLAIANLVGNAIKYVPADRVPDVRVTGRVVSPALTEISVSDNGYGIPDQYQKKIFEPFERLHRAEDHPGTGLGLAIVTRAVQKMGGQVGLESQPGQGSRFWIQLPATTPAPPRR